MDGRTGTEGAAVDGCATYFFRRALRLVASETTTAEMLKMSVARSARPAVPPVTTTITVATTAVTTMIDRASERRSFGQRRRRGVGAEPISASLRQITVSRTVAYSDDLPILKDFPNEGSPRSQGLLAHQSKDQVPSVASCLGGSFQVL